MGVLGGILLVIAVLVLCGWWDYRLKVRALNLAVSSTPAQLHELQRRVAQEIGGGYLQEYVKISVDILTALKCDDS
ncbi:hypothetical protein NIES2134_105770 [Thermostichus vulcanus NIES-2134]|nr:hypothetical protein NIES2134_105770 [Thermostichus vulcanus NIES-2134]